MGKAHAAYWDAVREIFLETLHSSEPDSKLRRNTQWRRIPWGLRKLEEHSNILDLPVGTVVPQIVIHENIRSRSTPIAFEYCVSPTFSAAYTPSSSARGKTSITTHSAASVDQAMLEALQDECAAEWGEYPRPISIQIKDGQWLFKFKNHEADKKPSTLVIGDRRKLLIYGGNNFEKDIFLPGDMSAQEWGDYLAYQYGRKPLGALPWSTALEAAQDDISAFDKLRMNKGVPFADIRICQLQRQFPEPISEPAEELKGVYSKKLGQTILDSRSSFAGKPMLIKSVEGIGKTSGLLSLLIPEALDRAMASDRRFTAFAFRSKQQEWSAYDGETIRLTQSKTGIRVVIPVGEPLKKLLDATPRVSTVIVTNNEGRPYTSDGFRASWRKTCTKAKVTGLTFHDIRGTTVTRLAIRSATEMEIATITGHSVSAVKSILDKFYLNRDPAMGVSAIKKFEQRTKPAN
jgi:hypothetical protein